MDLSEYNNRLANILTSQASHEKKTEALIILNKIFNDSKQKYAEILQQIEESSPEVPDLFTNNYIES